MGCFSRWDIGGCGCSPCQPCPLPSGNLTLSWSIDFTATGGAHTTGTAVLAYLGLVAGVPTYSASCIPSSQPATYSPAFTFKVECFGGGSGTTYTLQTWNDLGCTVLGFTRSYNTVTGSVGGLTISSATCSPLNITFGGSIFGGSTLTP